MGRKPKFRPTITRVKLNPEQAVLTCNCFTYGSTWTTAANLYTGANKTYCGPTAGKGYWSSLQSCVAAGSRACTNTAVLSTAAS